MKKLSITLLCILFSAFQPTLADTLPNLSQSPVIETSNLLNNAQNAQIILVGIEHSEAHEDYIRNLVLNVNLVNNDYNCKFWEESTALAEIMEQGLSDYSLYYDKFYEIRHQLGSVFHDFFGIYPSMRQVWPKNLKSLLAQGIHSIPVDYSYTDNNWLQAVKKMFSTDDPDEFRTIKAKYFLNERNKKMAEYIVNAFKSKKCKKAILSIGEEHLITNPLGSKYPSEALQNLLEAQEIQTYSVKLLL